MQITAPDRPTIRLRLFFFLMTPAVAWTCVVSTLLGCGYDITLSAPARKEQ